MKRRVQGGYTLIEIVVAFAILALGLTLLLGTLSGATRQVRDAGDAGRAALHAQSLLVEHGEVAQPGSVRGELDGGRYRWQLDVTEWKDPQLSADTLGVNLNSARMFRLQLQVAWGEGGPRQRIELSSLRWRMPRPAGVSAP
ncbi:MAG: prepilin-type N-terminal cleavage/methylation domain-containing protein [Pseudomonadota bacterium]